MAILKRRALNPLLFTKIALAIAKLENVNAALSV
jgi:hypothetical protein